MATYCNRRYFITRTNNTKWFLKILSPCTTFSNHVCRAVIHRRGFKSRCCYADMTIWVNTVRDKSTTIGMIFSIRQILNRYLLTLHLTEIGLQNKMNIRDITIKTIVSISIYSVITSIYLQITKINVASIKVMTALTASNFTKCQIWTSYDTWWSFLCIGAYLV